MAELGLLRLPNYWGTGKKEVTAPNFLDAISFNVIDIELYQADVLKSFRNRSENQKTGKRREWLDRTDSCLLQVFREMSQNFVKV